MRCCKSTKFHLQSTVFHYQVQPDMEELTENAEEQQEEEEKVHVQKLGKLQYRVSE